MEAVRDDATVPRAPRKVRRQPPANSWTRQPWLPATGCLLLMHAMPMLCVRIHCCKQFTYTIEALKKVRWQQPRAGPLACTDATVTRPGFCAAGSGLSHPVLGPQTVSACHVMHAYVLFNGEQLRSSSAPVFPRTTVAAGDEGSTTGELLNHNPLHLPWSPPARAVRYQPANTTVIVVAFPFDNAILLSRLCAGGGRVRRRPIRPVSAWFKIRVPLPRSPSS